MEEYLESDCNVIADTPDADGVTADRVLEVIRSNTRASDYGKGVLRTDWVTVLEQRASCVTYTV